MGKRGETPMGSPLAPLESWLRGLIRKEIQKMANERPEG